MSFVFPQQRMNLLQVYNYYFLFSRRLRRLREGMGGHPTYRQRALPSALPYVLAQWLCAGSPRPCALPAHQVFDGASSNLARRNKVNISCSSMRKLAVFAFCLALTTMSNPPGSPGKRPRIASLSRRFIELRSTACFAIRLLTTKPTRVLATSFGIHARMSSGDMILCPCCFTR